MTPMTSVIYRQLRSTWQAHRSCGVQHDYFPDQSDGPRECIPVQQRCLRCTATRALLPWGECLNLHPLSDHYNPAGRRVLLEFCEGPW
jgi:hypothetical protein